MNEENTEKSQINPSEVPDKNSWVSPRESIDSLDAQVDAIVNEEADELLHNEDEARKHQFQPADQKVPFRQKLKHFFVSWWQNRRARYTTFLIIFVLFITAMLVPMTRYALLNTVGVRVRASMVVVDSVSGRPLKNIPVMLQGSEFRTNDDGYVAFENLKQGPSTVKIEKLGFAPYEKGVTLGWGSNPLDEQSIVVTGARFNFVLKDWLSGEVLLDTEATSGENVGQSDQDGRIELVVGDIDESSEVVLSAKGYREQTLKLQDVNSEENAVLMVFAKKHPFVSNRDGEFDLYTIDVDGANEKLLLKATKKEREVPYVLPHPTRDILAFVSSRDGDTNKDGFVLDGLFIIDGQNGETYKVTRSEQVQVIGWEGDMLVYVSVVEGVSAGNSQRSTLTSYNLNTKERTELAAANYFNDVKLIDGTLYYAVSSYAVPRSQAKLFRTSVDGVDTQTVIDEQVWSIVRQDFETLLFNTESNGWFEQNAEESVRKLDVQPSRQDSRAYSVSPDGKSALWVDVRDGKGVLLTRVIDTKQETTRLTASGVSDPSYWISDKHIVYRVTTSEETADYVIHKDTGDGKKIADVIGNRSRYFY